MSELRQDPISGQWVIIAPERAGRPDQYAPAAAARSGQVCPFCAGHEQLTPAPLLEVPAQRDATAGWRIRVLPNMYPALSRSGDSGELPGGDLPSGGELPSGAEGSAAWPPAAGPPDLADQPALGCHEVIIESPDHVLSITDLSDEQFSEVLLVYRDRLVELKRDPRLACGIVFKNMGAGGGATIEHIHSQIIALPAVPDRLRAELTGTAQWRERHGNCAFCDLIEREAADGLRLVALGQQFVALCPWAARCPYETWILPRRHASHFEQLAPAAAAELAVLLRRVVGAVERVCRGRTYNYVIHSAPFDTPPGDHYHWHVEVIPRVTRLAGFEWASGWYINPVTPEGAAERLRKTIDQAEENTSSSASLPIR